MAQMGWDTLGSGSSVARWLCPPGSRELSRRCPHSRPARGFPTRGEQGPALGKQAAGETGDPEAWVPWCRHSPSLLAGIQGKDRKQITG